MESTNYQNILIAVDPENPTKVDQAIAIAKQLKSDEGQITLVTAITSIPYYVTEHLPAGLLEQNRKEAEFRLKEYVTIGSKVKTLAISSPASAGAALVDFASDKKVDLVIVASHRPGLKDYFLGSTAGRVVRHSPCAVHVIR